MANLSLLQLKNRVAVAHHEVTGQEPMMSYLEMAINQAQQRTFADVRKFGNVYAITLNIEATVGGFFVTLPSDFGEIISVVIRPTSSSSYYKARPVDFDMFWVIRGGQNDVMKASITSPVYHIAESVLLFMPVATVTDSLAVKIQYYRKSSTLAADSDLTVVDTSHDHLLIAKANELNFTFHGIDGAASSWKMIYDTALQSVPSLEGLSRPGQQNMVEKGKAA